MKPLRIALLALGLAFSLTACACRPAHIGPYGGFHPGGCILY